MKVHFHLIISVAMGEDNVPGSSPGSGTRHVPEAPISDLRIAQKTDCRRSKLCAEQIIAKIAAQELPVDAR